MGYPFQVEVLISMVRVVARNAVLICAIEILLMDEVTTVSCRKATRIVLERAPHKLDLSPILMRGGKIQTKARPGRASRIRSFLGVPIDPRRHQTTPDLRLNETRHQCIALVP